MAAWLGLIKLSVDLQRQGPDQSPDPVLNGANTSLMLVLHEDSLMLTWGLGYYNSNFHTLLAYSNSVTLRALLTNEYVPVTDQSYF